MLIKNGNVLLFDERSFKKKDILIENGKISKIADNIEGEVYFNAEGMFITPGLIDAHTHLGISEEGKGGIGDDCNDYSEPIMPYLETVDAIYPGDEAIKTSLKEGVTSVCVCPGSDSVIGGVCSTIRLNGKLVEEMVINGKTSMKCSFGENPKTAGYGFKTRMGNAYMLKKTLEEAKDYKYHKELAIKNGDYFKTDMGMENMLLVLNKDMALHAHAHRSDDIATAIRIAKEYDLDLVIVHGTDGARIAEYIFESGYPVITGPNLLPRTKLESQSRNFESAGILNRAGVKICITSDHDVTPLYYLTVYAGMAVAAGLDEIEGLKAITKNPAEVLRIGDRKGDLKVGFDADIVVWSKHPFDLNRKVKKVFLEGNDMI